MTNSSVTLQDYSDVMSAYNPDKNLTRNVLTIYEKTKVIGMRLEQLARGAETLVDLSDKEVESVHDIVRYELEQRKIPFIIRRTLPNGIKEYWRLADMQIPRY